jgi:hypothetical protein
MHCHCVYLRKINTLKTNKKHYLHILHFEIWISSCKSTWVQEQISVFTKVVRGAFIFFVAACLPSLSGRTFFFPIFWRGLLSSTPLSFCVCAYTRSLMTSHAGHVTREGALGRKKMLGAGNSHSNLKVYEWFVSQK